MMKKVFFLSLLFLAGCASQQPILRRTTTKEYGIGVNGGTVIINSIQAFVDGEWWTLQTFVEPEKK